MSGYRELGVQGDGEPVAVSDEPILDKPNTESGGSSDEPLAPVVAPTEPPPGGMDEEGQHKNKPGSQKQREKAMRLEIENELLKQQLAGKHAEPKPPDPILIGRPDPNNYPSQEEWVEAVADWKAEQKIQLMRAEEKGRSLQSTWDQKVTEGKAKFPDLIEVMEDAEIPSRVVAKLLVSPKVPIDVAHYLATHEEEYKAINRMDAEEAGFEIAGIAAKLSAAKPTEPKRVSTAPPPVVPIPSGSPSTSKSRYRFL